MANEISVTAQISVFKSAAMSTALARALNGVLFSMAGNFVAEGVVPIGVAGTVAITGATNANPIVVSTAPNLHNLVSNQSVTISGVGGNTNANGTWSANVLSSTTFGIGATGNGAYTSGGTMTGGATLIPIGLVVPHWAWFYNTDPTNFVQIQVGTAGTPFAQLYPGEFFLGPLEPTNAYYAIANVAAVNLEYLIASL